MHNRSNLEISLRLKGPTGLLEVRAAGLQDNNRRTVAIVCHPHPLYQGTMDNKVVTTLVRAFQTLDMATIRFNFRGVGQSEGVYGEGVGEVADLQTVIAWAQEQFPGAKIVLAGFSFGSYVTVRYLSELQTRDVHFQALFSVAPPVNLFTFTAETPFKCPWFIIQGSKDELVPVAEVRNWVDTIIQNSFGQTVPRLILLEEASHFFHGQLINLKTHIIAASQGLTR
jgi:alpha/beta superfamily hydrolase